MMDKRYQIHVQHEGVIADEEDILVAHQRGEILADQRNESIFIFDQDAQHGDISMWQCDPLRGCRAIHVLEFRHMRKAL